MLLIGLAGAFRRSELVALDVEDVEEVPEELRVTIRRSKTDQEGEGVVVALSRGAVACPVAAFKAGKSEGRPELLARGLAGSIPTHGRETEGGRRKVRPSVIGRRLSQPWDLRSLP